MPRLREAVIVIDWAYVNGGSAQVALSSAIALANSGTRVTVFAAAGPPMPTLLTTPNMSVVLTGQYDILHDPSRVRAAAQGIWNFSAASALGSILDRLDRSQTVVHFHGWSKALSSSVIQATTRKRFPVVITLHDYFAACPIGSLYNHKRQQICDIEPLSRTCMLEDCDPRSYRDKVWRLGRTGVQKYLAKVPSGVRHFITLSDLSERVLAPMLPENSHLHRVVNPITAERLPGVDVGSNAAYTYVGRLSREKGAVLFSRAARDAGVPAVFVGEGECATEIRQTNPSAEITGWLSSDGVRTHLTRARALVFPSLWYEVAPLVIREAAALGVPAIVSDTSAAREFVVDDLTGLHFAGGDSQSLSAALRSLENLSVVSRLGNAAYASYWASPCPMSRHLADIRQVYERAIADAA